MSGTTLELSSSSGNGGRRTDWPKHDDILHPGIDNPDDNVVHDQLGTVEQIRMDQYAGILGKSGNGSNHTNNNEEDGGTNYYDNNNKNRLMSMIPSSSLNKKKLMIGISIVIMLSVIIGVSVGISKKNKSQSQHGSGGESLSSNNKKPKIKVPNKEDRIKDVFDFVGLYSSKQDLLNNNSPQHKACIWMAIKDELHLKTPTDWYEEGEVLEENSNVHVTVIQDHYRFVQRYLLAVFYYAMNGDEWKSRLNFGNNINECQWYQELKGQGGGEERYKIGVQCDDGEHVSGLIIPDNNLKGELPPEIGYLKKLEYIIMQNNFISGSLPIDLPLATSLNVINLNDNDISGQLPSNLGRMEKLKTLELSNNNIIGPIPTDMNKLQYLETLSLNNNNMNGDISILSQIPSLHNAYLSHNMFTGLLNNMFQNSPNLIDLVLEYNQIGGSLPVYLLEHPTIKVLDLGYNNIQGAIPNPIPENNILKYLSLAKNEIYGEIPESIYALGTLSHLDVSQNNLNGPLVPQTLQLMNQLQYIFLDRNPNFNPDEIPEIPFKSMTLQIKQLTLGDTNRIGDIPPWVEELQNLSLLDVSQNDSLEGMGGYFCDAIPKLQFFSANCDLIENCNCCTCCDVDDDIGCISAIQQKGKKNKFIIPIKSFNPLVKYNI